MNLFLEMVLSNSLMAILLALLAAVVSLFKPRPAVVHGLWLLVLVKLVTPPLVSIPIPGWESNLLEREPATPLIGHQQSVELKAAKSVPDKSANELPASATPSGLDSPESNSLALDDANLIAAAPGIDRLTPRSKEPIIDQTKNMVKNEPSPEKQNTARVPVTGPESAQMSYPVIPVGSENASTKRWLNAENIQTILLSVWCLGSLGWLLLSVIRITRFQKLLRFAHPASAQIIDETEQLASQIGLRRPPEVVTLPGRISPLVWPIGKRVRLILPEELLSQVDQDERKTLIAHELIHLRRRDHWVRSIELVTLVVYWWHPVV